MRARARSGAAARISSRSGSRWVWCGDTAVGGNMPRFTSKVELACSERCADRWRVASHAAAAQAVPAHTTGFNTRSALSMVALRRQVADVRSRFSCAIRDGGTHAVPAAGPAAVRRSRRPTDVGIVAHLDPGLRQSAYIGWVIECSASGDLNIWNAVGTRNRYPSLFLHRYEAGSLVV